MRLDRIFADFGRAERRGIDVERGTGLNQIATIMPTISASAENTKK
jgi:hypothetical protein